MENAQFAAQGLESLRSRKPLIHNITNYVVMNFSANTLLAMGASPVMAHAAEEVEEMVGFAGALVLNIGTLSGPWIEAMLKAGRKANQIGVPVVLDPVGAGATRLRTDTAAQIIEAVKVAVLRGNASEIMALNQAGTTTKGVDSVHRVEDAAQAARHIARAQGCVVAVTGAQDYITDGGQALQVTNGDAMLGQVTGTGCAATAAIGAFLAVESDALQATAAALAFFGLAGEHARRQADAPGSFKVALMDALYTLSPADLDRMARIESINYGLSE